MSATPEGPLIVVGPGAVGCVLAAHWAAAGVPVALLARTAEAERALVSRGIVMGGKRARAGLRSARRLPREPKARTVFFCVKAEDLGPAIDAADPWIGPATAVVALQNGGRRRLRGAFGTSRLVEGVCRFGAFRRGPGEVVHVHGREILLAPAGKSEGAFLFSKRVLEKGGWSVVKGRREKPGRTAYTNARPAPSPRPASRSRL